MTRASLLIMLCLGLLAPLPAAARLPEPAQAGQSVKVRDLAEIRASRVLRVLVNQSRNSSGEVQGEPIGAEYHRLCAFEQYLNEQASKGPRLTLKIIPRAKEQLLDALLRGEGDLVAPGEMLDVQPTQAVSASEPIVGNSPLVLVGLKGERHLSRIEQLSGRTLALTRASAAGASIQAINQQLALRKMSPIKVEWVDPSLAVEDVLEMVQAGIFHLTVVEQPIAERWARVMPRLRLDRKVRIASPGEMDWYVRRDASTLRANIDQFIKTYRAPADQDAALVRAYRRLYQVRYPLARADRERLERLRPVLQRNAREQGLDWLTLAALAFKESALNPGARGAGTVGLLQITPVAARRVGVSNIQDVDNNVRAGARYLAMIRRTFFAGSQFNERERMAFVLAAYNMGPERVQAMRAEARRRGLNPNQWFFQVERIAMEQVGMGPVSFVDSVNKYYLAFARERESLEPQAGKVASRE